MIAVPPQPDEGQVELLHGSKADCLFNRGTGEIAALPFRASLEFIDGIGLLEWADGPRAGHVAWVRAFCKQTLHMDVGTGRAFVLSGGVSTWCDKLPDEKLTHVFFHESKVGVSLCCETYHSSMPRGASCIQWALPHILQKCFGDVFDSKWFNKRVGEFKGLIAKLLGDDCHWRRSMLSANMGAVSANTQLPAGWQNEFDQEFAVSTQGLMVLLLAFATGEFKADWKTSLVSSVREILEVMVDKFVDAATAWSFPIDDDAVVSGHVRGHQVFVTTTGSATGLASPRLPFVQGIPLVSAMLLLMKSCRRPSRTGASSDQKRCLQAIIGMIVVDVEATRGQPWWKDTCALRLPRLGSSTRCRRVSSATKLAVGAIVGTSSACKSMPQFLAVQNQLAVLGVKRSASSAGLVSVEGLSPVAPKSSANWTKHNMLQYMYATRRAMDETTVFGLVVDESRVGCKSLMVGAFWSGEGRVGAWMPPQVQV